MNEQILKEIRDTIDDHIQVGFSVEVSTGESQVFQLNARNFWDLVVKDKDENVIALNTLTLYPTSGQVKGTIPAGDVTFEYVHAGFTDAEITYYYGKCGNSTTRTSLRLVELLLASAAKRFDYKAGIKDIKASQVFDHLKELRATLLETIENEEVNGFNSGIFVDRIHPAYEKTTRDPRWRDVSRSDS